MSEEDNQDTGVRNIEYWDDKWQAGQTGWHMDEPNPHLVRHAHVLLPRPDKHRIFVPLCGKSVDILWLYNQGHRVVGVEGVERVVQEYGEENNLNFQVSSLDWGKLYQTADHRLMIYVCDFFDLLPHEVGRFDAVWDRGSLVAINESERERYAVMLKLMLLPHFRYLMSVVDYEPTPEFSGPPCPVPTRTIHKLFGDIALWKQLDSVDLSEDPNFKSTGVGKFVENFILLTPKPANR